MEIRAKCGSCLIATLLERGGGLEVLIRRFSISFRSFHFCCPVITFCSYQNAHFLCALILFFSSFLLIELVLLIYRKPSGRNDCDILTALTWKITASERLQGNQSPAENYTELHSLLSR